MTINEYHLKLEPENGWRFPNAKFERVNLIVGDSGTGKTRFLNTISNFANQATADSIRYLGDWEVVFTVDGKKYRWELTVDSDPANEEKVVSREKLFLEKQVGPELIVTRTKDDFTYRGKTLPRLSRTVTSISLLKDEEEIARINTGFKRVITRRFFTNELSENFAFYSIPPNALDKHVKAKDLDKLLQDKIGFQNKIYLLKEIFPQKYQQLTEFYRQAFPFITEFAFREFSDVQKSMTLPFRTRAFCFKEKNLDSWVPVHDISSGMQKVFLITLDLFLMPDDGIMLIDEYENSLGISAINFFPDLVLGNDFKCQFVISSHHPYIINNIPIENWLVFHRKGVDVSLKSGRDLKPKFGRSKQQYFTQLINDPFYVDGVE